MAPEHRRVTEAELAVMQVLWDSGTATTRQITETLYEDGGVSEYYTVQKLLERLEEKGCIDRDRSQRTHQFRASIERDELIGERLAELADTMCEGSLVPVLTSLTQIRDLTAEEFDALKQLVKQLDERSAKSRSSKPKKRRE